MIALFAASPFTYSPVGYADLRFSKHSVRYHYRLYYCGMSVLLVLPAYLHTYWVVLSAPSLRLRDNPSKSVFVLHILH